MTVLNSIVSLSILGYGIYLILHGRKENIPMYVVYTVAGIWASVVHVMVLIDYLIFDFMCWQTVTVILIKPMIFVLLCTVLASQIKSGWHYDH